MREVVVDVGLVETRVAVLEKKELVELFVEREDKERITGNVYLGRVVNVLPGMQAAFVDIGLEKNAFLYVKDALPREVSKDTDLNLKFITISDVVKAGQELVVQVTKEPFGTKGARVTTHLSIPGRNMVILSASDYIGVSKKIVDESERIHLRNLAKKYKPKGVGVILRTASKDASEEDFKNDMAFLTRSLEEIEREKKLGRAPKKIYSELDLLKRLVREIFTSDVERVFINNKEAFETVKNLVDLIVPSIKDKIEHFDEEEDIFNHFKINHMLESALEKKVELKSGSYLVIDETEALTTIDVNTGKYVGELHLRKTVLDTNLEAAVEIARQLRLRNIGGIIIIDFIDMSYKTDEKKVIEALNTELSRDKTQTETFGMTRLGLLEMTRKKVGSRLSEKLLKNCICCSGTGRTLSNETIFTDLEKQIKRTKWHTSAEAIIFKVSSSTREYIDREKKDCMEKLQNELNMKVFFITDDFNLVDKGKIFKIGKVEFIEKILKNELVNYS